MDRNKMHARPYKIALFCVACAGLPIAADASDRVSKAIDGRPDLSGVWDYRSLIPLERPEGQAEKASLTLLEAAARQAEAKRRTQEQDEASDADRGAPPQGADVGSYNSFWYDNTTGVESDLRTSLIVAPTNGRVPAYQPGVEVQVIGDIKQGDTIARLRVGGVGTAGPEQRGISERCLLGFSSGPPILPGGYNQNISITQTDDHVVILNEMIHDARIVPLSNLPRLGLTTWMGESRGHWEGDVMVVTTTSFTPKLSSFSPSFFSSAGNAAELDITERFQRIDEETLRYEFTVIDPATYTAPISGVLFMQRSDEKIFEYACHEGNYAMRNMLSGARAEEKLVVNAQN
ncbi:MAG: hypothetical protein P8L31_04270 [Pseudomonadales bacterium]|nr:hypothetical protein [Pseudomonadales bacterium]